MKRRTIKHSAPRRTKRNVRFHTVAGRSGITLLRVGASLDVPRPKILAAMLTLLLVSALTALFVLDLFYIFDFEVAGLRLLNKGEVERASGVAGYNIFFIDAHSVERTLAKLPEVKSVRVTTQLPNRMMVNIVERQPEVVWVHGAENYCVDADGIVFRARTNMPPLPVIHDVDQGAVKVGQRVSSTAIAAFHAFREAWNDGPRQVEWSSARGLAFTDEHGWKIYLGDAEEMAGKLAKLRVLVPQLVAQNTRVRFIDLGRGDPYYQ